MAYLIEVPLDGGGRLLVQASDDDLPGDLQLASLRPGEIVARAGKSVEQAMDEVKPAIQAVLGRLAAMAPAEVTVEFGLLLGAETGVIIAKGSGEVHFDVTLTWKRPEDGGRRSFTSGRRNGCVHPGERNGRPCGRYRNGRAATGRWTERRWLNPRPPPAWSGSWDPAGARWASGLWSARARSLPARMWSTPHSAWTRERRPGRMAWCR
jgi:hypothetical protein